MFNKEKSSEKRSIKLKSKKNLVKAGIFLIPMTLIFGHQLLKKPSHEYDEYLKAHFEYEKGVIEYLNEVDKLEHENNYDKKISDLYHNGKLSINNHVYPLDSFFIRYSKDKENRALHLICSYDDYEDTLTRSFEKYQFDGIVKFKNTTAFINYLLDNNTNIDYINNTIIIDNEKLLFYINNWDGMLHNSVAETDAIIEHKVLDRR